MLKRSFWLLLAAVVLPSLSGCSGPISNDAAANRVANASVAANATGPTATEVYALRERCGKDAEAAFALMKQSGGAPDQISYSYTNHYDPQSNECFMLTTLIWKVEASDGNLIFTDEILYNANDKTQMGEYVQSVPEKGTSSKLVTTCWVTNNRCSDKSEAAFRVLLEPYMGDLSYAPGAWG